MKNRELFVRDPATSELRGPEKFNLVREMTGVTLKDRRLSDIINHPDTD